ncbi:MAG: hypothetical protein PQJ59_16490 [Spirochaetales bacterium]|nr:hypothetical protein [Spirochaetales bacterium]
MDNAILNDFGFGAFGSASSGFNTGQAEALVKALEVGDSANPGDMGTGGNTLQFESLEAQLVSALNENVQDFKLMKLQPKKNVGSTVHQYTQETDSGEYDAIATSELGDPIESSSDFARITRNIKYFQTKREASLQANLLNPIVGSAKAEAVEERLGTHVLLKGTEYLCFHGNESVSTNQPNGYPQMIRNEAPDNVLDMSGTRITDSESTFEEAIRTVYEQGGEISDAFFPPILAQDWQDLLKDRYRYNEGSKTAGSKLTTYQSMYGNDIFISGRAGIDKMYKVKTVPTASTNANAPSAPTFALVAQSLSGDGTGFDADTAGTYRYTVYAVDAEGRVSAAATAANVAVASGEEAQVTITRGDAVNGAYATGYIVCRGKKDVTTGDDIREMYRVAASGSADTVTLDTNDELPGTAEILLLSSNQVQDTYQWDSFCDLKRFNLGATRASIPFLLVWYGTPDLKIAKRNALIKNVGHSGVSDWF